MIYKNSLTTEEYEIKIDISKYIPYLKIKKYYLSPQMISVSMIIDFGKEIIEIQRTMNHGNLLNHSLYDMSSDTINKGIVFFDRESIDQYRKKDINITKNCDFWYIAKYYDLNGRKHYISFLPDDVNNPLSLIYNWIKTEFNIFDEIRAF